MTPDSFRRVLYYPISRIESDEAGQVAGGNRYAPPHAEYENNPSRPIYRSSHISFSFWRECWVKNLWSNCHFLAGDSWKWRVLLLRPSASPLHPLPTSRLTALVFFRADRALPHLNGAIIILKSDIYLLVSYHSLIYSRACYHYATQTCILIFLVF